MLGNLGQLSHTELPVVELLNWAGILVVATLSVDILDVGLDFVLPSVEDLGVVQNKRNFLGAATTKTLALAVSELVEHDVALEGLLGFHELLGELLEGCHELVLLLRLTHLPLFRVHFVYHGPVDVVDEGLEDAHRVLRHFSEQNLFIGGALGVDGYSWLGVPHEVNTFAAKLDSLSCNY